MIKCVSADDDTLVKNINIAPDPSGPYNKVIHWQGKNADGYIILFTNAAEENAVSAFFDGIDKSSNDPKSLVTTGENIRVRVMSRAEFKSMGGKFVNKEATLVPTRVTILQYKLEDSDIVVYMGSTQEVSTVIPILVSYTVTYKKSMLFMGAKKAIVKIMNSGCMPETLFYKVTGSNIKYPITAQMIRDSFTVNVDKNNITVFAAGKYGLYYNVKQKRV